jgi:hypothetical protein
MNSSSDVTTRRTFLKLAGGAVALIPLVNLSGCGDEGGERPAGPPAQTPGDRAEPAPQAAPSQPAEQPSAAQPAPGSQSGGQGGDMPRLAESDPQAQALGYKHSAADVDQSAFPRYAQGQVCSNCNLYQTQAGDEQWGGCQIFPGKLVNADGWCSAYIPVP